MKIKISFFAVLMVISLFLSHSYLSLLALLAAALHELAHIGAARLCRIRLCELRLGIFGAALQTYENISSYLGEILTALAGPLFNIVSGVAICLLWGAHLAEHEFLMMFAFSSLFLGTLNLLPVKDFDGGRILYCLLEYCFSPRVAISTLKLLSFTVILSLWLLSVYLLLRLGASLSLFIFSLALFAKIFVTE